MSDKKLKLAIIGASYLQLPLILKAKEMGYETHVFAWSTGDVGEKYADFFYPISIVEKEEILKKCKEIGIVGICSIASDLATITVNYVAQGMSLPGNSMYCTEISTNKYKMRCTFEKNGVPSPKCVLVNDTEVSKKKEFCYPVIVKPTDRSGSRGIFKVEAEEDLEKAIKDAISVSFAKECLVEEYAEGKEYSVECITFAGQHHFLALTLKHTTGAPRFIETGHEQPAPVSEEILENVKTHVYQALDALEVKNGASHSEIKIDEAGNIKFIEIGARMGGDCIGSHLVRYSTGLDFVGMVIDTAVGKQPDLEKEEGKVGPVEIRYIMDMKDLEEFYAFKKDFPERVLEEEVLDLDNIGKSTDSSNRAGYYIIKK